LKSLTARELADLPHLYRTTVSSLSLARSISLDKNLVEYLEVLATRGYFSVYGPARRLGAVVFRFFTTDFPAAVREFRWHVALAALFLGIGICAGWAAFAHDSELFYTFIPDALSQGRDPAASTEFLRKSLYGEDGGGAFATFLFTHNASIGIMCFGLGFAAGLPVFLLMVSNGVIVGAFAALFVSRGLGTEFFSWVLPHGVTELLAIVLCAAGGLVLAQKLILPGRLSRIDSLAEGGRRAGVVATGAVAMLVLAALIEGIFRQEVHEIGIRFAVASLTALGWLWYFTFAGRRRSES
jgi:uncharacterized membrane protein SpoIIM required for sporulation